MDSAGGSEESRGQKEGGRSCLHTLRPHRRVGMGQGQHPRSLPPAVPVSHQPTKGNHLLKSDGLFHVARPCEQAAQHAPSLCSPGRRARLHLSHCSFSLFFSLNPFRNSTALIDHDRGTASVGSELGAAPAAGQEQSRVRGSSAPAPATQQSGTSNPKLCQKRAASYTYPPGNNPAIRTQGRLLLWRPVSCK